MLHVLRWRCAMTRREQSDEAIVRHWIGEVSAAAASFERRWTWLALKRVNPDLAKRFQEQRDLFDAALVIGAASEIELHGAATCRGYAALVSTMEKAVEPDDAYMLGQDPKSGFRIAVGHQKAAADRVAEVHGDAVVWITPDEVAALMAGIEGFKQIASIKKLFPGAEIIDLHPGEPAKFESGILDEDAA